MNSISGNSNGNANIPFIVFFNRRNKWEINIRYHLMESRQKSSKHIPGLTLRTNERQKTQTKKYEIQKGILIDIQVQQKLKMKNPSLIYENKVHTFPVFIYLFFLHLSHFSCNWQNRIPCFVNAISSEGRCYTALEVDTALCSN